MSGAMVTAGGSGIEREGFAGRELERRNETSATGMAAAMTAEIQARYIVALQRPRSEDQVRVRLKKDCERTEFADAAWYQIPRAGAKGRYTGKKGVIEGLTVRFAERAIAVSGNILQTTRISYDDDYKRMVNVAATDLETNAVYSRDILIEKTVEKRTTKETDVVLGKRTNSEGIEVSVVQATEAEIFMKESGLVSRVFRTEALRFVDPGTIAECERIIVATSMSKDVKDPESGRKAVADAFAGINVMPVDITAYLGHELAQCSPAEITSLRALFAGIRDGVITWAEAMAEKGAPPAATGTGAGKKQTVTEKLAERAAKKARETPAAEWTTKPGATTSPATTTTAEAHPSATNGLCFICRKNIDFERDGEKATTPDGREGWKHEKCSIPDTKGSAS